jgi:hypothetical protein
MCPAMRSGRSEKLMVSGFTSRKVILPFSWEKPFAVCTKRKSTFFTALPEGWAAPDVEALVRDEAQPLSQIDTKAAAKAPRMELSFIDLRGSNGFFTRRRC